MIVEWPIKVNHFRSYDLKWVSLHVSRGVLLHSRPKVSTLQSSVSLGACDLMLSIYCKTFELFADCDTSTIVSRCFRNLDNCLAVALLLFGIFISEPIRLSFEVFAIQLIRPKTFFTSLKLFLYILPLF